MSDIAPNMVAFTDACW